MRRLPPAKLSRREIDLIAKGLNPWSYSWVKIHEPIKTRGRKLKPKGGKP
jgi:hypothetical protein